LNIESSRARVMDVYKLNDCLADMKVRDKTLFKT